MTLMTDMFQENILPMCAKYVNIIQLFLFFQLSFILLGNLILVLIAWKIYGSRIAAKFGVARGSRLRIEELRMSMSELQLPKEHDFKFK